MSVDEPIEEILYSKKRPAGNLITILSCSFFVCLSECVEYLVFRDIKDSYPRKSFKF